MAATRSRVPWSYGILLSLILVSHVTSSFVHTKFLRGATLLALLGMAGWATARHTWQRVLGVILGVATAGLTVGPSDEADGVALAVGALYLAYVCLLMLFDVLRAERVTTSTIAGALSVYVLIGILYGLIFGLVEFVSPGSFSGISGPDGQPAALELRLQALGYFSFVTLTTLGYGDIAPVSHLARNLTTSEAILGQIFLVVLVARLVSVQASQHARPDL